MTASKTMTIEEIQGSITSSFSRFDNTFYTSNGTTQGTAGGPQSMGDINGQNIERKAYAIKLIFKSFGIGTIKDLGQQEQDRLSWIPENKKIIDGLFKRN